MCRNTVITVIMMFLVAYCECYTSGGNEIEARGKKKKIALFVYIADLILKKFFILKLVYAFIFFVVLHKAGFFLAWFTSYLKEKKHDHHEYHRDYYDYHQPYGHAPYRRQNYRS